jgi:hypothetical protein
VLGADELDADDQPDAGVASADAGAASADAGAPAAPAGCGAPLSMVKVKSGALMGGKTMDDYYPDLVGSGRWAHGGTAGPFDTGSRVGSIVQLVGAIGAYCTSSTFNLEQTVTYKRLRRDGATDPREGKTLDDIGKSGRDASKAPFRQEWSGPAVFVSMADQPNISYGAATNAEWDREFTTSLVGPSGRTSVSWSTSIRITNGKVASNTVT